MLEALRPWRRTAVILGASPHFSQGIKSSITTPNCVNAEWGRVRDDGMHGWLPPIYIETSLMSSNLTGSTITIFVQAPSWERRCRLQKRGNENGIKSVVALSIYAPSNRNPLSQSWAAVMWYIVAQMWIIKTMIKSELSAKNHRFPQTNIKGNMNLLQYRDIPD